MKIVSSGGLATGAFIWDLYAALDNGYLKKRGIDVEVISADSATGVQALASGAADAAGGISADSYFRAIDAGGAVTFGGFTMGNPYQVYAQGDIKTWQDLVGQKIATATAAPSSYSDRVLELLLKANGISFDDIQPVAAGASSDRVQAFSAGAVKAVVLTPPYNEVAEKIDGAHLLDSAWEHPETDFPVIGLGFSKKFITENPDAAKGFIDAYQEAHDWLSDPANKSDAVAMMAKYTKVSTADAESTYDLYVDEAKAVLPKVGATHDQMAETLQAMGQPVTDEHIQKYLDATLPTSVIN